MADYKWNRPADLVGVSNGQPVTTLNSGGLAGIAWDVVVGNVTYQDGKVRCTGNGAVAYVGWLWGGATVLSWDGVIAGAAAPTGGDARIFSALTAAGATVMRVEVRAADRRFVVYDAGGYRWTSPAGVVAPTTGRYRLHVGFTISGSAAQERVEIYLDPDSVTPSGTPWSTSSGNTGTDPVVETRGLRNNSTPTATYELEYAHAIDTQFTSLGPLSTSPPLITLGDDRTIIALTQTTIAASQIAGEEADAWSYRIVSDTSGAAALTVSGSQATLVGPAHQIGGVPQQVTVVVGCTPSAGGIAGPEQTVTVVVPPCQHWTRRPGTTEWIPSLDLVQPSVSSQFVLGSAVLPAVLG